MRRLVRAQGIRATTAARFLFGFAGKRVPVAYGCKRDICPRATRAKAPVIRYAIDISRY